MRIAALIDPLPISGRLPGIYSYVKFTDGYDIMEDSNILDIIDEAKIFYD